jgi:hypothetical protein
VVTKPYKWLIGSTYIGGYIDGIYLIAITKFALLVKQVGQILLLAPYQTKTPTQIWALLAQAKSRCIAIKGINHQ